MRISAIATLVLDMAASASGQILDALKIVKWSAEAKPAGKGEFDIVFTANVEKGWNVYATHKNNRNNRKRYCRIFGL